MSELIPISKPVLNAKCREYVLDCVDTVWISSAGSYIRKFEKWNADYYGTQYGVAVSNGTVALHLALSALGISRGDEVIVPDLTFAATANAVLHTGATPVLAEVEADSWTIDIDRCESLITDKTKAIIPVHLYGQPCNMDKVMRLAKKYSLSVVEDCAEAHGAEFKGKKVGSFGDISCFSFYGNKIITTGEGGICLTNSAALYDRLSVLRDHGMDQEKKYWHNEVGYNYRMTNMQAAIGCGQMEEIDSLITARDQLREAYDSRLAHSPRINLQHRYSDRRSVCWLYTVTLDLSGRNKAIEAIQTLLRSNNIDSRPVFVPMHLMPPYKNLKQNISGVSDKIYQTGISLPTAVDLREEQVEHICSNLLSIFNED